MRRDPKAYLWDVQEAADAIATFVKGIDESDYEANDLIRSAVERQLEIIGEALNQLSVVDESIAERIPEKRQAIGLRNVLIHGYAVVDNSLVWNTVCVDIPILRDRATKLLEELASNQ